MGEALDLVERLYSITADQCGDHPLSAVQMFGEAAQEILRLRSDIDKYRARLEVDHHFVSIGEGPLKRVDRPYTSFDDDDFPDGVECRDATIELQDENLARLRSQEQNVKKLVLEMTEHLAWLQQFAIDDDQMQSRNWRDNMLRIRAQIRRMQSALLPFQKEKIGGGDG